MNGTFIKESDLTCKDDQLKNAKAYVKITTKLGELYMPIENGELEAKIDARIKIFNTICVDKYNSGKKVSEIWEEVDRVYNRGIKFK